MPNHEAESACSEGTRPTRTDTLDKSLRIFPQGWNDPVYCGQLRYMCVNINKGS